MATYKNEHLILSNPITEIRLEFYLNNKGEIFAHEIGDSGDEFFFTINKKDWKEIKSFIDKQFETK